MAIIQQTKRNKIINLFAYVQDEINLANKDVDEEAKNDPRFKASYITARDDSAKQHLRNVIKAVGWLKIELQITGNISPFLDADIDALNREIRTFDKKVIIIALTAFGNSQEIIDRCKKVGMNEFNTKPLRKKELKEILDKYKNLVII